jgi:RNA-directed DNA polymerase
MARDLRALSTVEQLAKFLHAESDAVREFMQAPDKHVQRVLIPRHGSSRAPREAWRVSTPEVRTWLGTLQRELDEFLRKWFPERYPSDHVHGYVSERSALTNARLHAGHRVLLNIDVANFFPSIRKSTVRDALLRVDFKPQGAELLASFVTKDDSLPLGFPTSPLVSNLVLLDVDLVLERLGARYGATYSRYADDIAFSSDATVPSLAEVGDALARVGLALHPTKSVQRTRGQSLYVTGYSVSTNEPRAPRALKRRLRQELHYVGRFGLAAHVQKLKRTSLAGELDRIQGQIAHVLHVEPVAGAKLGSVWKERPLHLDGEITRPLPKTDAGPVTLVFDDSGFEFCKRKYRALGAVVLREQEVVAERIRALIDDLRLSALLGDRARKSLEKRGLHFVDLPEDFRRDAIDLMARIPARAHIVFDQETGSKKDQLGAFIARALKWRLADCRGKRLSVVFEAGEYINKDTAEALVEEAFNALPVSGRPLRIEAVLVQGKLEEPCVAVPDIFLGTWLQFACSRDPGRTRPRDRDEFLFRTLEQKVGTIYDAGQKRLYKRGTFAPLAASVDTVETS